MRPILDYSMSTQKGFLHIWLGIGLIVVVGGMAVWRITQKPSVSDNSVVPTQPLPPSEPKPADISVAGMSQYVDSDFGFSFWYPSGWKVQSVPVEKPDVFVGGVVKKELQVTHGQVAITIQEFSSPTSSIVDASGVGACPVCSPMKYYYDKTQGTWMFVMPQENSSGVLGGSAAPADVTEKTMGGLPMLKGSQRFGANTLIPLSSNNILVFSAGGYLATSVQYPLAMAKTIVATDPLIATPMAVSQQTVVIQAEADAYKDE